MVVMQETRRQRGAIKSSRDGQEKNALKLKLINSLGWVAIAVLVLGFLFCLVCLVIIKGFDIKNALGCVFFVALFLATIYWGFWSSYREQRKPEEVRKYEWLKRARAQEEAKKNKKKQGDTVDSCLIVFGLVFIVTGSVNFMNSGVLEQRVETLKQVRLLISTPALIVLGGYLILLGIDWIRNCNAILAEVAAGAVIETPQTLENRFSSMTDKEIINELNKTEEDENVFLTAFMWLTKPFFSDPCSRFAVNSPQNIGTITDNNLKRERLRNPHNNINASSNTAGKRHSGTLSQNSSFSSEEQENYDTIQF